MNDLDLRLLSVIHKFSKGLRVGGSRDFNLTGENTLPIPMGTYSRSRKGKGYEIKVSAMGWNGKLTRLS